MGSMDAEGSGGSRNITVRVIRPGVLRCEIQTAAYFMVGAHWKAQLTGRNRRKWGRIWIDPSKDAKILRRREALRDVRTFYTGNKAVNLDECPGAMFMWETSEDTDVEPLCAVSNQAFGSDLYWALYRSIKTAMIKDGDWDRRRASFMGWWEVEFAFVG